MCGLFRPLDNIFQPSPDAAFIGSREGALENSCPGRYRANTGANALQQFTKLNDIKLLLKKITGIFPSFSAPVRDEAVIYAYGISEQVMGAFPVFRFRLFVAGDAFNSSQAIANLTALCAEHLQDRHEIEVVDVFRDPQSASDAAVAVTPTLLKLAPPPRVAIVGTLSDTRIVLEELGLSSS